MYTAILVAVALLPAVVLCAYVFKKDRAEKEPVGLLLLLLAAGVFICFPTVTIGGWMEGVIDSLFMPFTTEYEGKAYLDGWLFDFYTAVDNFIGVALVEEGLKWTALILLTRKNKNFNSLFDGMIYAIFISLGFAGFENILYTFNYGMSTAFLRMVTAVPGHMFDAVFMGYYYSWYHIKVIVKRNEGVLKSRGLISKSSREESGKKDLVCSLLVPVLAHGFYDFCCTVDAAWSTFGFVAFLIFLYIFCFARIRKMSDMDTSDKNVALALLCKKYKSVAGDFARYLAYIADLQLEGKAENRKISFEDLCDFMVEKKLSNAVSASETKIPGSAADIYKSERKFRNEE